MNLDKQLTLYMDLRQLSLSDLSRKSGVPKTTIHSWLVGKKARKLEQVKAVATALDVSLDHLVFGDGRDTKSQMVTELDALMGEGWVSGLFEVKFRRVKK